MANPWSSRRKGTVSIDKYGELQIEGGYQDILNTQFTLDLKPGEKQTDSISSIHNKIKEEFKRDQALKQIAGQKDDAEKTKLKTRCNRIINQMLFKIDPNLV